MNDRIHLGFELGTGAPVSVPLHHAIVSGVTGLSGKTTAIAAMLSRLPDNYRSLVFSTKRGEILFDGAHQVQPFYRATVDWEYVSGVLEAARKERLKFERSWIIKASRGARSLRDVYQNIVAALESDKPLRGLDESVWTVLRAYFEKVLPELESQPWAASLDLAQGVNVMRLEHLSEEVQGLVIAASLEEAHKSLSNVVLVIPEAWLYVPQQRGSPVKWAAQHIIRQGRARGVYLWLDSQDVTGISKDVLKSVNLWILGRQREINEVKRTLDQLPTTQKPKPSDVMTLGLGHFFVGAEDWLKLVYIQPQWLDRYWASRVAKGQAKAADMVPSEVIPDSSALRHGEIPDSPKNKETVQYSPPAVFDEEEDPMVITDLRVQLANAEIQRDEAQRKLEVAEYHYQAGDSSLIALAKERDALLGENQVLERKLAIESLSGLRAREAEQATAKALEEALHAISKLEGQLDNFMLVRDALRAFLSVDNPAPTSIAGPTAPVDLDILADKVAARLGTARVLQVTPLESLKHEFRQEAVDRLVQQAQALDERPRQAILWLLSVGRPAKHMEICKRLSFPEAGASFAKFGTGIKAAVKAGFLTLEQDGLRATIWEKVGAELEPYGASGPNIEATYGHLLAALAESTKAEAQ